MVRAHCHAGWSVPPLNTMHDAQNTTGLPRLSAVRAAAAQEEGVGLVVAPVESGTEREGTAPAATEVMVSTAAALVARAAGEAAATETETAGAMRKVEFGVDVRVVPLVRARPDIIELRGEAVAQLAGSDWHARRGEKNIPRIGRTDDVVPMDEAIALSATAEPEEPKRKPRRGSTATLRGSRSSRRPSALRSCGAGDGG